MEQKHVMVKQLHHLGHQQPQIILKNNQIHLNTILKSSQSPPRTN